MPMDGALFSFLYCSGEKKKKKKDEGDKGKNSCMVQI